MAESAEGSQMLSRRVRSFARSEAPWLLSLLTLCTLAIAQPLFSLLSSDPTIFVGLATNPVVIVAFAILLAFGPALVLWVIELVAGNINPSFRPAFHAIFLTVLGTALFIQVFRPLGLGATPLLLLAIAAAITLAWLFARHGLVRRWLGLMAPLAVVLLFLFLFSSPATAFLTAGDVATVEPAELETDGPLDPVVMVVLDELGTSEILDGAGHIDPGLFPNLASLADDATWYRNATTVGPHTPLALSALLTGQYPPDDVTRSLIPSTFDGNLFSLLAGTHDLNVHEPVTRFCQPSLPCAPHPSRSAGDELSSLVDLSRLLYGDVVDPGQADVSLPLNIASRDDGEPGRYFDTFLDAVRGGDAGRPSLDFVHLMLPHAPYRYLPSGATYSAPGIPEGGETWQGPWIDEDSAWGARQRHLLQAQYADGLLGRLLDRLRELDRYDDSLIIVTADHGSAFIAGEPSRGLTAANAAQVAWVPLLVKAPGQTRGEVTDVPVENVDVLAFIAGELGVRIPWTTDGRPAGTREDDVAHVLPWEVNELGPGDDELITLDRVEGLESMLATETFGTVGSDPVWRPYQRGPYAGLVGTPLAAATVDERDPLPGHLTTPGLEVEASPDGPTRPVYVSGTLPTGDVDEVAVVVNGTIAAVLPTHRGSPTFWGMVPEDALVEGTNTFELYGVRGPVDRPLLQPVG